MGTAKASTTTRGAAVATTAAAARTVVVFILLIRVRVCWDEETRNNESVLSGLHHYIGTINHCRLAVARTSKRSTENKKTLDYLGTCDVMSSRYM